MTAISWSRLLAAGKPQRVHPVSAGRGPGASPPHPGSRRAAGFTITEAVVALGLTLGIGASFTVLLRQARTSLDLQPELASMRQDGRAALDRIAADLARAGSGIPVEVPVFTDLDGAGNQNPDGLDFLAAPERTAEASFEPVVGFDGVEVTLGHSESRLAGVAADSNRPLVVVFNDDKMTPRWGTGRVVSVRGARSGGVTGLVRTVGAVSGDPSPAGATVRIAPLEDPWHWHFRGSVDADTFQPGSGGGLLERGLQSLLGGVIESAVPGIGQSALASLTGDVVTQMLKKVAEKAGVPAGSANLGESTDGHGLFGLGQPGLVQVSRIRYWVRKAAGRSRDPRSVLMRRVNDEPPQPVGFVEDLQVRYVTGENSDVLLDTPPRFLGDMRSAARLRDHVVRAVDVSVQVRSLKGRLAAPTQGDDGSATAAAGGFVTRTYRRRVALRVPAAGVERRAWEELMQLQSLPTEIPRIGPLRYLPLPW